MHCQPHTQRIVGFDPGLNITGYGVIECVGPTVRLVEAGTVRSRGESLEQRLLTIYAGVREVLEAFQPSSMAIEQLFVHAKFPKTAILMGHARGVICLAAAQADLPGSKACSPGAATPARNRSKLRCNANWGWLAARSPPMLPTHWRWPLPTTICDCVSYGQASDTLGVNDLD